MAVGSVLASPFSVLVVGLCDVRDQLLAADNVWVAVQETADQSDDPNTAATLKRSIALLNKLLADTTDKRGFEAVPAPFSRAVSPWVKPVNAEIIGHGSQLGAGRRRRRPNGRGARRAMRNPIRFFEPDPLATTAPVTRWSKEQWTVQ
uniref:Uncharacterized protein n=1 Tax=Plectus sambesii TaxID=2011161 RepID=A0A914VFT6_9BILA